MKHRKTIGFFLLPVLLYVMGSLCILFYGQGPKPEPAPAEAVETFAGPATIEELRVDLNSADLDELCTLPGVGEITARRILEYRQEHGSFQSPLELDQIAGIGEKRLKLLLDYVCVEE